MSKDNIEKAFRIYCRHCECEYLEPIVWVEYSGITECPNCHNKLKVS